MHYIDQNSSYPKNVGGGHLILCPPPEKTWGGHVPPSPPPRICAHAHKLQPMN